MKKTEISAVIGINYYTEALRAEAVSGVLGLIMTVAALFILMLAGYIIILKNFSIRKIGKKLEESEILIDDVFKRIPVGIAAGNAFGNFSVINPTFEKITGWTKEQLKNIDWEKITHPDDLPLNIEKYEKFNRGETDEYSLEKEDIKSGRHMFMDRS